ncbi:hypothetical protein H6G81_34870 [Scytonema hofmannii FACHB-248]|uniref:ABC transporter permease n=1 Tax=Scytonema hofmannii FACHB-248 TaxID=1842502 RepID=A0ABR8H2T4_9CYAN|nr:MULTISPECIES: hypothetical protein [Nostocales]MBD2609535.1 hypothetical protein [Scytonema hofmannii FACHB-248]
MLTIFTQRYQDWMVKNRYIISGITDIVETFRRNVFTTGTSLQFAGTSLLSVFILQSLIEEQLYSTIVL